MRLQRSRYIDKVITQLRLVECCSWRSMLRLSFFFSSRRRHTRLQGDWSSDVCSSDLLAAVQFGQRLLGLENGQRAVEPARVDFLVNFHRMHLLSLGF